MSLKVVDASAAAALLFGEPEAETVAARLEGAELRAPAAWPHCSERLGLLKSHAPPGWPTCK